MKRNETADPGIIIGRLKAEVKDLKAEIALLKGGNAKDHLTSEDIDRCNKMVQDFANSTDPEQTLILPDRLMINQCFYQFRQMLKKAESG